MRLASSDTPGSSGVGRYLWVHDLGGGVNGGTKAKRDAATILEKAGWTIFDTSVSGSRTARARQLLGHVLKLLTLRRSSLFFVQFPLYTGKGNLFLAEIILRRYRTVVLLHDVERLRPDMRQISRENLIEHAEAIISTGSLQNRLSRKAGKLHSTKLEAWDYLVEPEFQPCRWSARGKILLAGSLHPAKLTWLYRSDVRRPALLLYGNDYKPGQTKFGDEYRGPFDASNFKANEDIGWGLVWDGSKVDSVDTADDYERVNQPHKVSLYLACGLPLIVWNEAAIAAFVTENRCGVTVSSLGEIEQVLVGLSDDECGTLRENAVRLGQKAREGAYLRQALARLGL